MGLQKICVGIAGTAKNTGKTTTTVAILSTLRQRGIGIFLTSIGYDGEDIDNVTGLPKPKIFLAPGDIVATAERCLEAGTAKFKLLHITDIQTPLGRISIVKIKSGGMVVVAGPNKSSDLRQVIKRFRALGPGFILIDGALNRMAPMVETDGLILATGAAYSTDIPRLAAESSQVEQILQLPLLSVPPVLPDTIALYDSDGEILELRTEISLFSPTIANKIRQCLPLKGTLWIPGILGETAFCALCEQWCSSGPPGRLLFADPLKLLVAGKAATVLERVRQLANAGIQVGVRTRIPLLAVTINPYYPQYRMDNDSYQPAYVDFHRLQVAMRNKLTSPVYDIMRQGAENLVDALIGRSQPWIHPSAIMDFENIRVGEELK